MAPNCVSGGRASTSTDIDVDRECVLGGAGGGCDNEGCKVKTYIRGGGGGGDGSAVCLVGGG
ncbi:conserved hypothetical protein [Ricinus communis]|uniref:Uncharacterized protein n=1 Tax=Ricinus communis TaxID=3988 RepID=B9SP48_RICCO|nr:conserved hypothetical protein [Ricinus communis]